VRGDRQGAGGRRVALVVLGLACAAVVAGCGGVRTGDDDTTSQATTTTGVATSTVVPTTAAPSTSPDARQNEDIVAPDVTVDPALVGSSYCQRARAWERQNPLLRTGYDPRNPAELESAYRATAEHQHALLDVAPAELQAPVSLVVQQWDAVVALFEAAQWDYGQLFERQSAQVAATLQGDRETQNATTTVSDYDVRVCGVG
jgi:hypothetical protein